jgi:trehalose 6-phosphate phosphatase
MIHALSPQGREQLAAFLARRPLVTLDIDGTLAPIVARPEDARIPDALQASLRRLAACTEVALLTGRGRNDALRMADFPCAYVLGNHGIEGLPGGEARTRALAAACAEWRASLDLRALDDAHIALEDKRYSLSLHYRHAPDHAAARRLIAAEVARLAPPPTIIDGKCVVNLLPPGAPNKGSALRELLASRSDGCAIYAGDDDTDEHVFDLPRDLVLGVRVGRSAATQAALYLDGPDEMLPLTEFLRATIEAR